MDLQNHNRVTSAEIASLWSQYLNDSMGVCVNSYMLKHLTDTEIIPIFEYAVELGKNHLHKIREIFNGEKFPIPVGFTKEDVNLDAPALYSDSFCLFYLHEMTIHGLNGYAVSLPSSTRKDIRSFYVECSTSAMELYNRSIEVLLAKGIYDRPPYISITEEVKFVKNDNFITGWLGDRRSLNAIEIGNISFNLKKSVMSKALFLSFSQVAKSKEVRDFFLHLTTTVNKHIEEFSAKLQEDYLPTPPSREDEISDSTIAPFSDKLMMFHAGFLVEVAVAYYGAAMAVSMRPDLIAQYGKIITEDFKGASKWIDIMMKNEWLEKPPQAVDRNKLAKMNKN